MVGLLGCDTTRPDQDDLLVVEAWLETGQALPPVRITSTLDVAAPLEPAPPQGDLRVQVEVGGRIHTYLPTLTDPLIYMPESQDTMRPGPGQTFEVRVEGNGQVVRAAGVLPPVLRLLQASVSIPDHPVPVVLLDSLQLGLDSLALDIDATTGFVYPVQVSVEWEGADPEGWIEARLQPSAAFSSSLLDFFLLPSQVFKESSAVLRNPGQRLWEGVYAVPVASATAPLPEHDLRIVLLRSNDRYAQYASSRTSPVRREPITNVIGGLGFVGGISVDSLRVHVRR
ncbi:MAG: hypothetical protein O3C45_03115 [Bacteroidetes bacterium]|nr:hypothetical protein [Bacteroidota bacterium]MDA0874031.1 hypothetical protein [Bacteroidota bacterium]